MDLRGRNRGQAMQVGAILLFGLLIVSLSIAQVTVVPQENAEVEFESYLDASEDMEHVWSDLLAAGTQDAQSATTVTTGTTYPSRVVLVNPGPPTGSLSTTTPQTVTFADVTAVESEHANVRTFWNGTDRNYTTASLQFRPAYNEFDGQSVHTTGVAVYRQTDAGPLGLTAQSFVDGNRITLVTVAGNVSTAGRSVTVVTEPVSVATQSVTVTGDGDTFNVTLPTPGNASAWNNSDVADAIRNNRNVESVEPLADRQAAIVTFDGDRTYDLRLARVVVRAKNNEPTVDDPAPKYVRAAAGNQTTVEPNSRHRLAVEVRDRFDNPRSGAEVTFTTEDGTFAAGDGTGEVTVPTTDAGRAAVAFTPDTSGPVTVQARFAGGSEPLNSTTFELAVETPADINPNGTDAAHLQRVNSPSSINTEVNLTFNNTASEDRTLESARISFYHAAGKGALPAGHGDLNGDSRDRLGIKEDFEPVDQTITLSANSETTVQIGFTSDDGGNNPGGSGTFNVKSDYFVLSLTFEERPGTQTYYVAVPP